MSREPRATAPEWQAPAGEEGLQACAAGEVRVLPGDSVSGFVTEDSEAVNCAISWCSLVMHFLPHEALLFPLTGS